MEINNLQTMLNLIFIAFGSYIVIKIAIYAFTEDDPTALPKGMMLIAISLSIIGGSYFFLKNKIDEFKEKQNQRNELISKNVGVIIDKEKTSSFWFGDTKKIVISVKYDDKDTLFSKIVDDKTFYSLKEGDSIQVKNGKLNKINN